MKDTERNRYLQKSVSIRRRGETTTKGKRTERERDLSMRGTDERTFNKRRKVGTETEKCRKKITIPTAPSVEDSETPCLIADVDDHGYFLL